MRGNATHYRNNSEIGDRQLRKLMKARNKYMNILKSLEKEIYECQQQVRKDMHCLSVVSADLEYSFISE